MDVVIINIVLFFFHFIIPIIEERIVIRNIFVFRFSSDLNVLELRNREKVVLENVCMFVCLVYVCAGPHYIIEKYVKLFIELNQIFYIFSWLWSGHSWIWGYSARKERCNSNLCTILPITSSESRRNYA